MSLNAQIIGGALLGTVLGFVLGHTHFLTPYHTPLLGGLSILGKVFIFLLKTLMVPLIFTSITAGIANLNHSSKGSRLWPVLLLYSLATTCLAAITGLIAMNWIKAGVGSYLQLFNDTTLPTQIHVMNYHEFAGRLLEGLNPLTAFTQPNVLGIVFWAIISAGLLTLGGAKTSRLLAVINKLFEIIMKIVSVIMRLAPLGIMGLLGTLAAYADAQLLYMLSKYILVVLMTTLFHGLVSLPLILWGFTGRDPRQFFSGMKEALVTAFSTSSSTATLPVSLRCVTDNLHVNPNIARFVLPVGAVLNMDGTAMYEAMAALFVANICGAHLDLWAQISVMLTAMIASIGAPGIPSAGMVTMIMVLQSVGLPVQAVGLLIAIDRPLDTVRTLVNVEGDCIAACVVQRIFSRRI